MMLAIEDRLDLIISIKNLESEIVDCNATFLNYTNLSKDFILGKTDYDLPWGEFAEKYHKHEKEAIEGNIYQAIHPSVGLNGERIFTFNTVKPYTDESQNKRLLCYASEIKALDKIKVADHFFNDLFNVQPQLNEIKVKTRYTELDLTVRQSECLYLLVRGKSAKHIAKILNLSYRTIEHYIEHIKVKLKCYSKSQLIDKVIELGLYNISIASVSL